MIRLPKYTVNLQRQLLAERQRQMSENQILAEVVRILDRADAHRDRIRRAIRSDDAIDGNDLIAELLSTDRIFHREHIRKICIAYRLRFLPAALFTAGIPEEAVSAVRRLENEHKTSLSGFSIVAPSKTFRLANVNDPLLFVPIGNDYFYLVHKWGDDLNASRRIWVWPFRNLATFTATVVFLSFVVTWLTPENMLSRSVALADIIVFLFAFKSIFAVALYCFFILGKKFNCSIWDSEYFND